VQQTLMDKVKAHATSVKVVLLLCFGRDNLLLLTLEEPHAARQAGPASLICAMRAALRATVCSSCSRASSLLCVCGALKSHPKMRVLVV
jgi:hypothetical protein